MHWWYLSSKRVRKDALPTQCHYCSNDCTTVEGVIYDKIEFDTLNWLDAGRWHINWSICHSVSTNILPMWKTVVHNLAKNPSKIKIQIFLFWHPIQWFNQLEQNVRLWNGLVFVKITLHNEGHFKPRWLQNFVRFSLTSL